jgi:hypothetical protein
MSDTDDESRLLSRDTFALLTVLFVGVVGTGVVRRQLGLLGYDTLGQLVFALGYGGTVVLIWFVWVRPLDITGPTADGPSTDETDDDT